MTPAEKSLYRGTTASVTTFEAYDRASGQKLVLDDRTFDPALHSLDPALHSLDPVEPPVEVA